MHGKAGGSDGTLCLSQQGCISGCAPVGSNATAKDGTCCRARTHVHAHMRTHSRSHTCTRVLRPHPHAPTLHATSRLFHILFRFLTCISPPRLFQPLMSQNYANIFCKILYIIMDLFCLFVCFAFTGVRVESDHTCKPIPGHGAEVACVAQTDGVGAGFAEQGGGIVVSSVGPRRQPYCSAGERESCCIGLFVMNRDPKKILYFIFFIIIVVNIIILWKNNTSLLFASCHHIMKTLSLLSSCTVLAALCIALFIKLVMIKMPCADFWTLLFEMSNHGESSK